MADNSGIDHIVTLQKDELGIRATPSLPTSEWSIGEPWSTGIDAVYAEKPRRIGLIVTIAQDEVPPSLYDKADVIVTDLRSYDFSHMNPLLRTAAERQRPEVTRLTTLLPYMREAIEVGAQLEAGTDRLYLGPMMLLAVTEPQASMYLEAARHMTDTVAREAFNQGREFSPAVTIPDLKLPPRVQLAFAAGNLLIAVAPRRTGAVQDAIDWTKIIEARWDQRLVPRTDSLSGFQLPSATSPGGNILNWGWGLADVAKSLAAAAATVLAARWFLARK